MAGIEPETFRLRDNRSSTKLKVACQQVLIVNSEDINQVATFKLFFLVDFTKASDDIVVLSDAMARKFVE